LALAEAVSEEASNNALATPQMAANFNRMFLTT